MKFLRLVVILPLCSVWLSASSQSKKIKEIEMIATTWAEANAAHDIDRLTTMYSNSITFYGRRKAVSVCMQEKQDFFTKNPDYSISISDLDIDFYKSGIVKCNFIKHETWGGKTRNPQLGYLLLKKSGNQYQIIAESDQRMDTQLGTQPKLGDKVTSKNNLVFIIAGVAVVLLFIFYFIYWQQGIKKSIATVTDNKTGLAAATFDSGSKAKGDLFEEYIVNQFDARSGLFVVKRWRSDKKAANGLYDVSSKYPDLEFMFSNDEKHKFAIECKWRQSFEIKGKNLGISWAPDYKISEYLAYENEFKIPVWVAIGVGGSPDKPAQLYLAKLSDIAAYPFVFESHLRKFMSRNPAHRFSYNSTTRTVINQY